MNEPSNYSSFVTPDLQRGRLDAQWAQIAERLPERRKRTRGPLLQLSGAVAVVFALAGVWWWSEERSYGPSVWAGAVVTSDDAPVNFSLAEGTLIELEPRSEVELLRSSAHAVKLSLKSGSARFDVAKRRTRRFSVRLGEVEVLVTGTQFRLKRSQAAGGERIRVDVEEGSVEVRRAAGSPVRLTAGEHWSTFVGRASAPSEQVASDQDWQRAPHAPEGALADLDENLVANADEAIGEAEDDADENDAQDDSAAEERRAARRNRRRARVEEARSQAEAALVLFDQANAARRLGQLREAAATYAELVQDYPRDRRAALAAFELGRIRMDSLGDTRGAVDALERALKLDARRAFAEDALARLVLAQETLGNRAACESARGRYLSRYPDGVHAQHVSARCTSH
jgi:TolA-binding protein